MKILNIKTKEVKEIKDKKQTERMLRYPDLFQELKETPKEEPKEELKEEPKIKTEKNK